MGRFPGVEPAVFQNLRPQFNGSRRVDSSVDDAIEISFTIVAVSSMFPSKSSNRSSFAVSCEKKLCKPDLSASG